MFKFAKETYTLTERTENYIKSIDALTKRCFNLAGGTSSIFEADGMDDDTMLLIRDSLNLLAESKKLIVAQAEILDKIPEIDSKLDKLIAMQTTKASKKE